MQQKAELMESVEKESPGNSFNENSTFGADSEYFNTTRSVASLISVHGDESRDTLKPCTETAVSESCGNAETTGMRSSATQKSKREVLEFDRLSIGSNCSNSSQETQQSSSSRLKHQ